jgi:DNA polymerase/3'-5' exonuclease PolX
MYITRFLTIALLGISVYVSAQEIIYLNTVYKEIHNDTIEVNHYRRKSDSLENCYKEVDYFLEKNLELENLHMWCEEK